MERPPLESVHRALRLVLLLQSQNSITVKEAAEELDVVPSTAYRLLTALVYDGFAVQDAQRHYLAGPALQRDVPRPFTVAQLRSAARGPLEDLSRGVNETVQLWVRQGTRVRFIDGVEGTQPLSVRANVWDDSPAVASAAGRTMLAELTDSEIEELHGWHRSKAHNDWASSKITTPEGLMALMAEVRRRGYALSLEENSVGVNGVARSVKDCDGLSVAAISVAIPTARFTDSKVALAANALKVTTQAMEAKLHGR